MLKAKTQDEGQHAGIRNGVLIADDDPALCEVMAALFTSLGYQVLVAHDGETACDLLPGSALALAVVDLNMPKLNGFELLRYIRQYPRTVDVPVIISTSCDDAKSIEDAYRFGAASFVTKPINWPQFRYHAQFVIRNGQTERELRRAEAAAVMTSKMKNGLFRILSHELKTPLVALIGLTDVLAVSLQDKVVDAEKEQLGHVIAASTRLKALINDILLLSKSFSGQPLLHVAHEPMADLLDDSIVGLMGKARSKNLHITITPPSKDLFIDCDVELMRQAIGKLVDNAIKFSFEGGTIEIWAHCKPDRSVVISVRDNGTGLTSEKLADCLQPFVQEDMSYGRRADGLGLGLPIVQSIAEAHGGGLICHSKPGEGMVAAIWIPDRSKSSAFDQQVA